jgi:RNA polymerase sigma factor (TIGR02999 family)
MAANVMRILVNHAKRRQTAKRGAGHKVTLDDAFAVGGQPELEVLALDKALDKLAQLDKRQCQVVEMRFFAGLREEDIADVLGISPITVKRDWRAAKAMLRNELQGTGL